MNALNTTRVPPHTQSSARQNPDPAVATLLAVAFEVPDGGLDHRVDLAAVALRPAGERYTLVGSLHCVLHAGMSAALIGERCCLPLDQVRERTPVAVALTVLEGYLTAPPYLLVTHQAPALGAVIARHAGACPALNAAHLVDITVLARRLLGERCPPNLPSLAAQLGVTTAPRSTRTAMDAALTGALYAHLHRIHHGRAQANADARPTRPVSNERTGHPQISGIARAGQEVRHGQAA
ncbi:MAG TPA: hypothetical protein VGS97_23030 [Actinocrinis sp.]|uniref:hypothetical protein n=1 Tax=Actinocrinis sp. TaxID=1920516 RepID=UPI002DDD2F96|nr:hypothetical protein [Actinocrinis sp.]HEV2346994.1 hypothetical protein [Actinocrinis sp.]